MSFSEVKKKMIENVLLNFFLITIAMGIYLRVVGNDFMAVNSIFAVAIMSVLTGSAELVLYSKKELRRLELLVRHIICLVLGIVIVLSIAILTGWISWSEPIFVAAFAGMVVVVHVMSTAIDFYRTKLKTDEITKKIREMNR